MYEYISVFKSLSQRLELRLQLLHGSLQLILRAAPHLSELRLHGLLQGHAPCPPVALEVLDLLAQPRTKTAQQQGKLWGSGSKPAENSRRMVEK